MIANYSNKINSYLSDLYDYYATDDVFDYNDLSTVHKKEFANKLLDIDNRDLYFINEDEDYAALISLMLKGKDIQEIFCEKIIKHYKNAMQQLIDDYCSSARYETYTSKGLHRHVDQTNGEITWRQSL